MIKKVLPYLVLPLFLLLAGCQEDSKNVERAIAVFFIGVLQMINLVTFGICAIVFSALSTNPQKPVFRILGWAFFGIFTLFVLLGFLAVTEKQPRHWDVYMIFMVETMMIGISLILLLRKPGRPLYKNDILDERPNRNDDILG